MDPMKATIVIIMVLGFILLISGSLWTTLFPATSSWTEEKATRSSKVKNRLNDLGYLLNRPVNMQNGADRGALQAELKQLTEENQQLNADFQSAYDSPRTASKILKWSGISLAVVGLIGLYAVNQSR
jgi:hypothetical protein